MRSFSDRVVAWASRVLASLVVVFLGWGALMAPSASAASLNVTGTYSTTYHCQKGWCAGQLFPSTTVYTQATGSDQVYDDGFAGTLTGNHLNITVGPINGYTFTASFNFSNNGHTLEGKVSDSNGTSGYTVGTLESTSVSTTTTTTATSGPLDGQWHCCGQGGASPQTFVISGSTGTDLGSSSNVFATITDTVSGAQVSIVTTYTSSSEVVTFNGTLNGDTITGTWTSSYGPGGTFTATKAGTAPPPSSSQTGDVAPLAASISTPAQVFHSMGHNIVNAALTVGVILFITFPANIFNRTFQANYDEIQQILQRWRRRVRSIFGVATPLSAPAVLSIGAASTDAASAESPDAGGGDVAVIDDVVPPTAPVDETPGRVGPVSFAVVLGLGALLGGLLNPHFGMNATSIEGFLSTLISFAIGAGLSWFVARSFRRFHHYATVTYLQALPLGLAIAAICVAISRLSSFEPGYLYGVVVGISFAGSLRDKHSAHLTTISVLSTLAVALAAWFLWLPVSHLALEHDTNTILVVADDVLGSIFVGGLVGTVISLIPIDFLPGKVIAAWHRGMWALVFFVATFLLIEVELRPASGATHPGHASIETALALFAFFGGATFLMRWYFERRLVSPPAVTPALATESISSDEGDEA